MAGRADLLATYDRFLRTGAETAGAITVTRLGPLLLVVFGGGRGFITYGAPTAGDADVMPGLVGPAIERFRADPSIVRVEWKSRGHDVVPGLHEALIDNGFEPDETESVMLGEAAALDVAVELPQGVRLRRVTVEADIRAMAEMEDEAFMSDVAEETVAALVSRLSLRDGTGLWVAEAAGKIVGAGRLEPVAGSPVAGIWGGAVLEAWRGRGIYRALTAVRARSALALGKTLIHSDSTEYSRPILERAGLHRVTSTTPWMWRR